jgi:hypothetical protein
MAFGNQGQLGFTNPSLIIATEVDTINGGVFLYQPTRGTNKLLASGSSKLTTDRFGNIVLSGWTTYWNSGLGTWIAVNVAPTGSIIIWKGTDETTGWSQAAAFGLSVSPGPTFGPLFMQSVASNGLNFVGGGSAFGHRFDGTAGILCNALNVAGLILCQSIVSTGTGNRLGDLNIPANTGDHFGVDGNGQLYLIAGTLGTTLRAIAQVVGDTNNRWQMNANGLMSWGSGAAAVDTFLQRVGIDTLATDRMQFNVSADVAQVGSAPGAAIGFNRVVGALNNMLFQQPPAGNGSYLSEAMASDFTATTVTGTGNNPCGKQWSLPTNDMQAGDCYEFDLQIFGKQGTTAETINLGWQLNGTAIGSATLANAFAAINANFICKAKLTITIVTTGAGGTYTWLIEASGAGGNIPQQNIGGPVTSALPAINTTISNVIQFTGGFGASTVGCTFTTSVTRMRKIA